MQDQKETQTPTNTKQNPLFVKLSFITCITLLLLIPAALVKNLISDRKQTKSKAIHEIGEKWGKEQTLVGPILTIPYKKVIQTKNFTSGEVEYTDVIRQIHILPESLKVNSNIVPQRLSRGIFEVAVYDSQTTFTGNFEPFDPLSLGISINDLLLDKAIISIGISDMRGIQDQVIMNWDETETLFTSGTEIQDNELMRSGIHAPIKLNIENTKISESSFSFDLDLKGSDLIYFTPVGKKTQVDVASSWTSPSFDGHYLPETSGKLIDKNGFKASWNIIDLNRNFPQFWTNQSYNVKASSFGVNLFIPADNYQRSERSIKYAILFIGLTFLVFFFIEIMNNRAVHPVQYILVGLALCLFYTLLLSISEHSSFNLAYGIASIMTLALVSGYSHSILKNSRFTLLLTGILSALYCFIFVIIQLEDLALLVGSIGLFFILGIVMYFSRKIDWNSLNQGLKV